jgi:hypothetical protein
MRDNKVRGSLALNKVKFVLRCTFVKPNFWRNKCVHLLLLNILRSKIFTLDRFKNCNVETLFLMALSLCTFWWIHLTLALTNCGLTMCWVAAHGDATLTPCDVALSTDGRLPNLRIAFNVPRPFAQPNCSTPALHFKTKAPPHVCTH